MDATFTVECRECGKRKGSGEFARWWKRSMKGWCKECRNAYRRRRSGSVPKQARRVGEGVRCGDCRKVLPHDSFWWRDRGYGQEPGAYCKSCVARRRAEDRQAMAAFIRRLP